MPRPSGLIATASQSRPHAGRPSSSRPRDGQPRRHAACVRYPADGFAEQVTLALDAAVADRPDTEPLRKLVLAS
ncbi:MULTISPECIES: hypothetical protein [Streptomyces]|uniref:hypothetical protein n=1 Tax=Streptomyces TaxID=1883 RepID=UPI00167A5FD0|nr:MULTISPECIES: hypothetical protein [Streptomyces]MBD3577534.1 hypothetical protein [Streptomyces sp. KD18]GGT10127.1 hypothetical protein GCM10010286_39660 [Streptomyces toxytricini]